MAARTNLFVGSFVAHIALMVWLGRVRVTESHAATAIEIADVQKAKKEPPPKTVVEPEPPKPEHRAPVRRAAAAPPPPALNTPPPPAPRAKVALSDALPDFGLSLSGAVGGNGVALPQGTPSLAPAPAHGAAPVHRALKATSGPSSTEPGCDDPATKPHPISAPQPGYNTNARAAGVEGVVRVRLSIDETGKVVDVSVIQGLGYGLDEAAIAAAREATFEPATQCGKPVRAAATLKYRFSMTG